LALQTTLFRRRSERDKHDVQFGLDATRSGRRILTSICVMSASLAGCASHGAPTYPIVGAFFPGWMFCAVIGIVGAIAARGLLVATGLNRVLPFQLFVCSAFGVIIAALAWLLWFGQ
jgi:YtcA family